VFLARLGPGEAITAPLIVGPALVLSGIGLAARGLPDDPLVVPAR
jgi:hypothetical protein